MKKHPILNLCCNADGTIITFNNKQLHISYTLRNGRKESGTVSIKGKKRSVATIVCECYYGLRDDKRLFPVRKDDDATNNHYTNLSWGKRRGNRKINEAQISALNKAFAQEHIVADLAAKYNVSEQTISSYKRKYINSLTVVDAEFIT